MSEAKFLVDQLKTTFNGDSWHGPNLVKTREGIGLENTKTRYLEDRHTIWELTNHIIYWLEEVKQSVKDVTDLNHEGNDWPEMDSTEEWAQSSSRIGASGKDSPRVKFYVQADAPRIDTSQPVPRGTDQHTEEGLELLRYLIGPPQHVIGQGNQLPHYHVIGETRLECLPPLVVV